MLQLIKIVENLKMPIVFSINGYNGILKKVQNKYTHTQKTQNKRVAVEVLLFMYSVHIMLKWLLWAETERSFLKMTHLEIKAMY